MNSEERKRQKLDELYRQHDHDILKYLKTGFHFQNSDAEDILHQTFEKISANIVEVIGGVILVHARGGITKPVLNKKAWVFKIAKNVALDFIKKKKKEKELLGDKIEGNENPLDKLESPTPSPSESIEETEKAAIKEKCLRKALEKPHAICPLLVALSELKRPIKEIAQYIYKTVPETEKLLNECLQEKKGYKDYYNDYQKKHSRKEGAGSLCWLIFHLIMADNTMEEIGDFLNKEKRATERAWGRCLKEIIPFVKECLRKKGL